MLFLYRENLACKIVILASFLRKMGSGNEIILHRPRRRIFDRYFHLPKVQNNYYMQQKCMTNFFVYFFREL